MIMLEFRLPTGSFGIVGNLVDKMRVIYNQISGVRDIGHGGEGQGESEPPDVNSWTDGVLVAGHRLDASHNL